jgi:hypothetical protein
MIANTADLQAQAGGEGRMGGLTCSKFMDSRKHDSVGVNQ